MFGTFAVTLTVEFDECPQDFTAAMDAVNIDLDEMRARVRMLDRAAKRVGLEGPVIPSEEVLGRRRDWQNTGRETQAVSNGHSNQEPP